MAGRSAKKKNSTAPLKKAVTLIAVFVVLLFTVLDLTGLVSFDSLLIKAGVEDKPAEHAQTEVHFIDVGQGDSTLVISQGEAMLIDSGDKDDSNKIEKYLEKQGVTELKYLIATHPHADHIGEMSEIIDQFQVDKFIMPKVKADMTPTTTIYEKMLKSIKAKGLKITQAKPMEFELGSCKVKLFTPKKDYDDLNNASVTVAVQVWLPLVSGADGVKLHAPVPSACTVPTGCPFSYTVTVALAVAVPFSVGVVSSVLCPEESGV